jgi:hypothetical protein
MINKLRFSTLVLLMCSFQICAQTSADEDLATADLAEVDRRLNNPLTNLWSLTFQNNTLGQDTLQAKG